MTVKLARAVRLAGASRAANAGGYNTNTMECTRDAQGVGERSGGLRVRVPSSQDTHRYESGEYQTCRNE